MFNLLTLQLIVKVFHFQLVVDDLTIRDSLIYSLLRFL